MNCSMCGAANPDDAMSCARCQVILKKAATPKPGRSPSARQPSVAPAVPGKAYSWTTRRMDFARPDCCACCLGRAETEVKAAAQERETNWGRTLLTGRYSADVTTYTFGFPYCLACEKHLRGHRIAVAIGVCVALAINFGFCVLPVWQKQKGWDPSGKFVLGVVVGGIVAGVLATLAGKPLLSKPGGRCAAGGAPVTCSFRDGDFVFRFQNPEFGRRLAELNV